MDWYDNYNIGDKHVDMQHRKMVDTISQLQLALSRGAINQEIGNTLKFLVDYTKRHFRDEEELMKSIGYGELEHHQKLHGKLIEDVTRILLDLRKGKQINALELIDFLIQWMMNHILTEDKKIGRAIARKEK